MLNYRPQNLLSENKSYCLEYIDTLYLPKEYLLFSELDKKINNIVSHYNDYNDKMRGADIYLFFDGGSVQIYFERLETEEEYKIRIDNNNDKKTDKEKKELNDFFFAAKKLGYIIIKKESLEKYID